MLRVPRVGRVRGPISDRRRLTLADIKRTGSAATALHNDRGEVSVSNERGNPLRILIRREAANGRREAIRVGLANLDATVTSKGSVRARVRGGLNNDNLTLNIVQPPGVCLLPPCSLLIDAFIDGGPGFDVCNATSNVFKINCER